MGRKDGSAQWISMSDMMTGLMLIFLLISVAFMYQIELKQQAKKKILVEYSNSKVELYKELKQSLKSKEQEWDMHIGKDLSIKFANPDVLFEPDSTALREKFVNILNEFIPKYLSIINSEKYRHQIQEIRIEGHAGKCLDFEYEECLNLSQQRANSVLLHWLESESFKKLSEADKEKMKFWVTSNGMSNGKNVDMNGEFVYYSGKEVDPLNSRRVSFRIITNSEDLVEKILEKEQIKLLE